MSEKMKSLEDLFHHELKDLYSAEQQLIEALPEMVKQATNTELKNAIENHLEETKAQKTRLEDVCDQLGIDPSGHTCKAMQGLIKEARELMKEDASPEVMDAALIAAAQRVEHYEIAGYGTACAFAESLGHSDIKEILGETLEEEKGADEKLTEIASSVNQEANV